MPSQSTKPAPNAPAPCGPAPSTDAIAEREKAEQQEVAGRHKNDGQKPYKGAR